MDPQIEQKIKAALAEVTGPLRDMAKRKVDFWQSKSGFDEKDIVRELREYTRLLKIAFLDESTFPAMPNEQFARIEAGKHIRDIVRKQSLKETDMYVLAHASIVVTNGEFIRRLGEDIALQKVRTAIINILEHGKTTHELKEATAARVLVTTSSHSALGVTIAATNADLRAYKDTILKGYQQEVAAHDTSLVIDLARPDVRERAERLGLHLPSDDSYNLPIEIKVGLTFFNEALELVPVGDSNESFVTIVDQLSEKLISLSNDRAK